MIAYKLLRVRPDGSLGPLFIHRKAHIDVGVSLVAQCHPTKGYKVRPGWHCCSRPFAPHLSKVGRIWAKVQIPDNSIGHVRPAAQGGLWYTAEVMKVLHTIPCALVDAHGNEKRAVEPAYEASERAIDSSWERRFNNRHED